MSALDGEFNEITWSEQSQSAAVYRSKRFTLLVTPEDSAPWKSTSRSSAKLCLPIPFHNGSHVRRALITANASQAVHRKKQFTAINCDARYSSQKNITAPQTAAFHTSSSPQKAVYRHERTYTWIQKMGTGCPCVENDGDASISLLGAMRTASNFG